MPEKTPTTPYDAGVAHTNAQTQREVSKAKLLDAITGFISVALFVMMALGAVLAVSVVLGWFQ